MHATTFLAGHAVFTTRQFATLCESRIDASSRKLVRLAVEGAIVRVARGVWTQPDHPRFAAHAAVPALLGNEQGYVSFLSAMRQHGLISQIPGSIQVATTGHTRTLATPIGRFEFLRMKPAMMVEGIELSATEPPYGIATAAKSLLDTLYVATRKGRRFASLPELRLEGVGSVEFRALLARQVTAPTIRHAIDSRLKTLAFPD